MHSSEAALRGSEICSDSLLSYVDLEARVPSKHPLRAIRAIVDEALSALSADFDAIYSPIGRPSILPEQRRFCSRICEEFDVLASTS